MTSFPDEKMIAAGWIDKEDVDPGEIFMVMLTDYHTRTGIDVGDVVAKLSAGTHVVISIDDLHKLRYAAGFDDRAMTKEPGSALSYFTKLSAIPDESDSAPMIRAAQEKVE